MKRLFLAVIAFALANNAFGQISQNAQQRYCGSHLDFSEMQRIDPQRYQRFMDYEDLLQNELLNSRNIPTGTIYIPVVVHVVHHPSNPLQNIPDAQIHAQIQILNQDFRRTNANAVNTPQVWQNTAGDANIEFYLATLDPNGNPTTGITRTSTSVNGFTQASNNVKFTSTGGRDPWNTQRYLNIWGCNFSTPGLMGYSTFPTDFASSPNLDGVVVSFRFFGVGGHTESPYNLGRTLTHEVGHWLDLRHIWGDAYNCNATDFVADTPNQFEETYGHPTGVRTDVCTGLPNGIMYMNYMDYTNDACMNMFTNGQIARMRALFHSQNGTRRGMLPSIIGSRLICIGSSYPYTVTNAPAGFTWNKSTNLSLSGVGTSITVSGISNGPGWVSINIGGHEITRRDVWVGHPQVTITTSATEVPPDTYAYFNAETHHLSEPLWTTWSIFPSTTIYGTNNWAYAILSQPPGYEISAGVNNVCGTGGGGIYVSVGRGGGVSSPHSVYPNPANEVINIELGVSSVISNALLTYEIRLYDLAGNLQRLATANNGTVRLDVSDLPVGIYSLHISEGGNDPDVRLIAIER